MTITLTYDYAAQLLRRIAGTRPRGYRNDDSRYFQDDPEHPEYGCPICLIGHLFGAIGISYNYLLTANRTSTRAYNTAGYEHPRNGREIKALLKEVDLIDCDARTRKLLRITQHLQDEKHTWRRAVGVALDRTRDTEGGETPVTGWNPQCRNCGETWNDQYDFPPDDPGRFGWDIASNGTALCGDCTLLDHTQTA